MARIEILGSWARPFSNRVEMALNLKSIPYDLIEGKSLFTHMIKSDRLVCLNPVHKKIPILIHGGMPVCESLIILEYIHDTWTGSGPSILPSDLFDHSLARFWASNLDDKWFPTLKEMDDKATDKSVTMAKIFKGVAILEDVFAKCSKGRPFFGGDNIGYLDIALGCYLGWINVVEFASGVKVFDQSRFPSLAGWKPRFRSHAAVKDVVPNNHKLVEFYMTVRVAA